MLRVTQVMMGMNGVMLDPNELVSAQSSLNEFGFSLDRERGDLLRSRVEPNWDIHCLKGFHVVQRLV